MRRFVDTVVMTAAAVTLGVAVPVAAQEVPRTEVSGGWQLLQLKDPGGSDDQTIEKGWYADVAGNLTKTIGIVFQGGGSYKEVSESFTSVGVTSSATVDIHLHQFMGGVRVSARTGAVVPFGEFLVGGINGSSRVEGSVVLNGQTLFATSEGDSSTRFALQAAGGANIMFTDRIGVRGTVGYIRLFVEDEGVNIIRVGAGIVVGF